MHLLTSRDGLYTAYAKTFRTTSNTATMAGLGALLMLQMPARQIRGPKPKAACSSSSSCACLTAALEGQTIRPCLLTCICLCCADEIGLCSF
jgi:hypothetical protein